jgi:membrane protein DedA with SNARE-associated domain
MPQYLQRVISRLVIPVRGHGVVQYMNPLDWASNADALASPVAGLALLIESAGVPFPGELLLLAAAAWATSRHQSPALIAVAGFLGAAAGSDAGYALGHRGGRPFVERFGALFHIRPERLARAELLFARHGDRAILIARFVPGLRTWASMLAGMARMPFWRFQVLSALGDLVWIAATVVLGYLLGSNLALIEDIVHAIGIGGVVFAVVIVSALLLAQERAARRR